MGKKKNNKTSDQSGPAVTDTGTAREPANVQPLATQPIPQANIAPTPSASSAGPSGSQQQIPQAKNPKQKKKSDEKTPAQAPSGVTPGSIPQAPINAESSTVNLPGPTIGQEQKPNAKNPKQKKKLDENSPVQPPSGEAPTIAASSTVNLPGTTVGQEQKPSTKNQKEPSEDRHAWKKKKSTQSAQTVGVPELIPAVSQMTVSAPPVASAQPAASSKSTDISIYEGRKVGNRGQRIKIESNYLTLNVNNLVDKAYHYDIVFDPDKPKKALRKVFNAFREKFPKNFMAFDGWKSFYTPSRLNYPGSSYSTEVSIVLDENRPPKTYKITVKEVNEIDLKSLKNFSALKQFDKPQTAIQCLDIVLMEAFNNNKTIKVGHSFFDAPHAENEIKLGDGYALWIGLFQSTVLGWKPYLNIDVAHKAFPVSQPLIDLFLEMDNRFNPNYDLDQYTKRNAERFLKGLRIGYNSPFLKNQSSQYNLFNGFMDSAEKQTFSDENGRKMTIAKYFEEKGTRLRCPKLPCAWVGNTTRKIYLPAEFCFIAPGQSVNRKLPEGCTTRMIREAATSTSRRKAKTFNLLQAFPHNKSPVIKGFGISVGDQFVSLDARVMPAPIIEYSAARTVTPARGVWRGDNFKFATPRPQISKWAVFNVERRCGDPQIRTFEKCLIQCGRAQGVDIAPLKIIQNKTNIRDDREIDSVMSFFKDEKVEIIFVVIPDSGDIYSRIKVSAETKFGILTQCIKGRTMSRMNSMTAGNILLKVNTKLNGINHKIAGQSVSPLMKTPFMAMGADVTHPSPDQQSIPSVVGVVSSYDRGAYKYKISWRLQSPKDEMIRDLENITIDSLRYFMKQNNNVTPQRIFYFRDGVSEGQFKEVMNIELRAIQAACGKVKPGYRPLITFIVVQKRHHTRFFPVKGGMMEGKHENVMPGTIVDTEIVHPNQFQYYLVSHASIQGVARPTKYCILYDDSNIAPDDLQGLTYDLCHLFSRCNRTVSYPAPTYYAHLVAARGRAYIETSNIHLGKLDQEYQSRRIQENIIDMHPMFFV